MTGDHPWQQCIHTEHTEGLHRGPAEAQDTCLDLQEIHQGAAGVVGAERGARRGIQEGQQTVLEVVLQAAREEFK